MLIKVDSKVDSLICNNAKNNLSCSSNNFFFNDFIKKWHITIKRVNENIYYDHFIFMMESVINEVVVKKVLNCWSMTSFYVC